MAKTLHALFFIILLGLLLRLPYLDVLPYWDWDEGVNQNIAGNLADGKSQWFSLKYVWVPHPPLYLAACALMLKTLGNGIYSMRLLSVGYSLLTIMLVYLLGKEIADKKTGLISALLFSVYPKAVYWNRMAFSNNQLMFLSALAFYSLLLYLKDGNGKWFYLCAVTLSLSLATGFTGLSFLVSTAILLHWYRKGRTIKMAALSASLFAFFALAMLWRAPDEFLHDFSFHFGRFSSAGALIALAGIPLFLRYSDGIKAWFEGYFKVKGNVGRGVLFFYLPLTLLAILLPPSDVTTLEAIDYYWVASILGFVYITNDMHRTSLWVTHLTYLLTLLGFNRADHMVLPAYPLMALGVGVFLTKLYDARELLFKTISGKYGKAAASIIAVLAIYYPIGVLLYHDVNAFIFQNDLVVVSPDNINKLNDYINRNIKEDDLVLTYSYLAPYVKCTTSELQQAMAYEGKAISYYPGDFKPDRFAFNTSIRRAKYIVLSGDTLNTLEREGYKDAADEIRGWKIAYRTKIAEKKIPPIYGLISGLLGKPLTYETGEYIVYENPAYYPSTLKPE
jgi:4-amino-4-deoxy-L-arabinose transferase-like glycosyltransferase